MKKNGFNLVKLAVGLAFGLMVTGCVTAGKSVSKIGFDYFEQFRNDNERLVYFTSERTNWLLDDVGGTAQEDYWFFSNLYIFTNEDEFDQIENAIKTSQYKNDDRIFLLIFDAIAPFSPVAIPNNKKAGKGIGAFKLSKDKNKIMFFLHVGNSATGGHQAYGYGISTLESEKEVVLSFATGRDRRTNGYTTITFTFSNPDNEPGNGTIRERFNSCDGNYGFLYQTSEAKAQKKTQPGFIEIK